MRKLNLSKMVGIVVVLCVVMAIGSLGQTLTILTTLLSFDGTNGADPHAGLVQGTNGNLYGITIAGGAHRFGTVFEITTSGKLTTLHSFCSQTDCPDGDPTALSLAGLVQATDGNLYGTTRNGGTNNFGTVFKVSPSGSLITLHSFKGGAGPGCDPEAGLVEGTDGNLYGTNSYCGQHGYGTVFRITPTGTATLLHSFFSDGGDPVAGLVQGTDGNFYGTTTTGGAHGWGTVFKMTASGTVVTLHSFDFTDGTLPAALVQGSDGNFYGTTESGGAHSDGTVFKMIPTGALTTLHSFSYATDGGDPVGALVQATDGSFYGTTYLGGAHTYGTVFKISPTGTFMTLQNFDGTDGVAPEGTLVQATNGKIYGTTSEGGTANGGTVFSLSVGLGPFAQTLPTSGNVGATVTILGNNLASAANVTFNGKAAAFTIVSSSEIKTTVPIGATTGKITVKTASGRLFEQCEFPGNLRLTETSLVETGVLCGRTWRGRKTAGASCGWRHNEALNLRAGFCTLRSADRGRDDWVHLTARCRWAARNKKQPTLNLIKDN